MDIIRNPANVGTVDHSCGEYMITLTLNPSLYHKSIEEQAKIMKRLVDSGFKDKKTVVLELTKTFNIHCHFYYRAYHTEGLMRHIYKLVKQDTAYGKSFYVKPIFDKTGLIQYLTKSLKDTQEFVHPVMYDDFNLIGKKDEYLLRLKITEWEDKHDDYECRQARQKSEVLQLNKELNKSLDQIIEEKTCYDYGISERWNIFH